MDMIIARKEEKVKKDSQRLFIYLIPIFDSTTDRRVETVGWKDSRAAKLADFETSEMMAR